MVTREKSLDLPDRHRQEARRRLMAAKRAASFRQNSVSERADSIEIYIPEAQTRLWEDTGVDEHRDIGIFILFYVPYDNFN